MKPRNRRERTLVRKANRILNETLTAGGSGASPIQRGLQGSWMGKGDAAELANTICAKGGSGNPTLNGTSYVSIAYTIQGSGPDCVLAPASQVTSGQLDPSEWVAVELKTGTGNWSGTAANHAALLNKIVKFGKSGGTASSAWNAIYANPQWNAVKSALTAGAGNWWNGAINNLIPASWNGAPSLQQIQSVLSKQTPLCGDHAIVFSVANQYIAVSFGGLTINGFIDGDDPNASMSGSKNFKISGPGGAVGTFNIQQGLASVSKVKFSQTDADFVAQCVLNAHQSAWPNWDVACQQAGLSSTAWDKATIADFCIHGAHTPYSGDPETIYGANHWACNSKSAAQVKQWHARSVPSYSRTASGMGLVFAILSFCFGVPYVPAARRTDPTVQTTLVNQVRTLAAWMGKGNSI